MTDLKTLYRYGLGVVVGPDVPPTSLTIYLCLLSSSNDSLVWEDQSGFGSESVFNGVRGLFDPSSIAVVSVGSPLSSPSLQSPERS